MQLRDLKLDSSRLFMVDIHGKKYPIRKKKGKECYYIQHAKGQLTVTSVLNKYDFEPGTIGDYIFNGWFLIYEEKDYFSFAKAELSWLV